MLQSLALAAFALTNSISVPHLIVLSLFQGVVSAFDLPVRQAMVVEFVEKKERLGNAIALNSSLFNLARLVGPAIGGFVIAAFGGDKFGVGMCFLIDAISYFAVIVALLMMKVRHGGKIEQRKHPLHELYEGFKYSFGFPPVRAILALGALMSIAVSVYQTLMPMFVPYLAPDSHGAKVFGFLGTAVGVLVARNDRGAEIAWQLEVR